MSETDGFIEEVSEELRRDRLFAAFRKYGWIAVLVIFVIVGAAAFREFRLAQDRNAAQALGDRILAALSEDEARGRAEALAAIDAEGSSGAVVLMLRAATAIEASDPAEAAALYAEIAEQGDLPARYRDLAALRRLIILADSQSAQERIVALTPLTAPGAPYRVLAEEQIALAEIENGDTEAAMSRLQALLNDQEATAGLRRRASDVIVALGGTPVVAR